MMDLSNSARERRKAEQRVEIMNREEHRQLREQAETIAAKPVDTRTPEDLIFIQQNGKLIERAERRARELVLEEERKLEIVDSAAEIEEKCQMLVDALKSAKHVMVYTGAGISTAADIPDYRGPNGVWTRREKGETCVDPAKRLDLTKSLPTYTHMALVKLHEVGLIKYLVSQNCDGLHVRSGFPRDHLSEVHGNMFLEMCGECEPEVPYFRSFDLTTKTRWRRHRTGRQCHRCNSDLEDTIVLFGEKSRTNYPMNWQKAGDHSKQADLVICLGSSLRILKDYPCLWRPEHKLFIVNLQWTPKDAKCDGKIHGRCDEVMRMIMERLQLTPDVFDPTEDQLEKLVTPLRRREVPAIPQGGPQPGWFGLGVKGLIKRTKGDSSCGRKKKRKL